MSRIAWSTYSFIQFVTVLSLIYGSHHWLDNSHWSGLLIQMTTADSLFAAMNFLLAYKNPATEHISWLDKCLLYSVFSLVASGLNFLSWGYLSPVWQISLLTLTCPSLQSNLFQVAEIQDLVALIHQKEQKLTQSFVCYVMSRVINSLAKINLNTDPQISHTELLQQIDFQQTGYLWKFLKIFLVNTLIKLLGKEDSFRMRLLKYLYQQGHIIDIPENQGSILPIGTENNPKQVLRLVIYHRRWHYLYDPRILNSLIELYQSNQDSYFQQCLQEFLANLRLRTLKYGTIWTLCSVISIWLPADMSMVIYPMVTFLLEYRHDSLLYMTMPRQHQYHLGTKLLAVIWYLGGGLGYLSAAIISEYLSLLDNQGSRLLLTAIWHRRQQWLWYLSHQNTYNGALVAGTILSSGLGLLAYPSLKYIGLTSIWIIWSQWRPSNFFVWQWLACWGWFSNYYWGHLLGLAGTMYLRLNLADYHQIPVPNLELNLYHSYYHK